VSYCIDTSSLIEAWERRYPPDVFQGLWQNLEHLVRAHRLVAPEEVREELKKKTDGVWTWAKNQPGLFVPVDEGQQVALGAILAAHPRLVDSKKGRSGCDPWVIALAQVRGLTVVTDEKPHGIGKPHIPDVCMALKVTYIPFVDLIKREKWKF
jgi:Domain of unknown function (DUF4411)